MWDKKDIDRVEAAGKILLVRGDNGPAPTEQRPTPPAAPATTAGNVLELSKLVLELTQDIRGLQQRMEYAEDDIVELQEASRYI